MSEPVTALGALLREQAAECGSSVTRLGTLFVRVTRHGNDWALELCDDKPISTDTAQEWANAVGVPLSADENATTSCMGQILRYEWQGTEDAAPAGTPAFYLGGAR